jgi:signal transduction histidine kinase
VADTPKDGHSVHLNLETLTSCGIMAASLLGTLLLQAARGAGPPARPLAIWGGSMLLASVGLGLLALGRAAPERFAGWPLESFATMILLLAAGLPWMAARLLRPGAVTEPRHLILAAAGALLWVSMSALGFSFAAQPAMTGAAYALATGFELSTGDARSLPSRWPAAVLMALHGSLYAVRALADFLPDPPDPAWPELLMLESLMHTASMAVVLLALTRELAAHQATSEIAAALDLALASSDAKSRFLARMSHELRTPLNGVLGFAQALALDPTLRPAQRERAEMLERGGRHLMALVNDSLDLAAVEAGKLSIHPETMALRRAVDDALDLVRPLAETRRIRLLADIAPNLPEQIEADPVRLRQVLLNLLGNAVKFGGEHSDVLLRAQPLRGNWLRLEVLDQGPGIPAGKVGQLFLEFTQLQRNGPVGTGLGLAVSRAMVTLMGGRIGHSPPPEGRGAMFWVELPQRYAAADPILTPILTQGLTQGPAKGLGRAQTPARPAPISAPAPSPSAGFPAVASARS